MGPVIVAEDFGVFEELTACNASFEFRTVDKVVSLAVYLVATRLPRGVGDGKRKSFVCSHEAGNERRLPRTRGRRNDENRRHSILRDCSRMRSISALAARPRSVRVRPCSPRPPVFARMVLVSRFIS